jgi:diacylglycerol O-acyltransferase
MTRPISILDLAFFALETAQRPMNVGPLIVLNPPRRRSARPFADVLFARMLKRPAGAPFNLKLSPLSLTSLPVLVPDPAFAVANHVHRITLPKPGTMDMLLAKVCELHPRLLDRSRPLWEFYLIDGVEGGRVALYAKVHHGIVDGVGFMKILARWLTDSPTDRVGRAIWEGVEAAGGSRHARHSLVGDAGTLLRSGVKSARTVLSLGKMLWKQGMTTLGTGAGAPLPFVTTPDVLRAAPSPHRSLAHCTLSLERVKALGKTREATINDMLLTILDIAVNRYLEHAGWAPGQPLVADMPVALGGGSGGNRIAIMQIPLGAPALDPLERLDAIKARTRALKAEVHGGAEDAAMLHSVIAHALPGLWETLGLTRAPLLANLVVSNPFGFTEKHYLMGAEIDLALPISVVAPGQVLNITAVNYVDRYQIAFLAITEAVPDIERLARYTEEAYATLAACLSGDRAKLRGRPRSRSKRGKESPP